MADEEEFVGGFAHGGNYDERRVGAARGDDAGDAAIARKVTARSTVLMG